MSTGVVVDGRVYQSSDGGIIHCLDLATGEVLWRERLVDKVCASLLAADGKVYVFDREGQAVVLQPGPTCEVIAKNQLDSGCMASPAIAGNALFVRTQDHLYRIEAPVGE